MLTKRSLICLGAILLVAIIIAVFSTFVRKYYELDDAHQIRKMIAKRTTQEIAEIKEGKRFDICIYAPFGLEMLVAQTDCTHRVKQVHVWAWTDLSDTRWSLLKRLPNLESLDIYDSSNAENLIKNIQGMESLQRLVFDAAPLSDKGMQYVATLPNLRELDIGGAGVTNTGLAHLRGHPTLEILSLNNTAVSDAGLAVLKDIPKLRSLVLFDHKLNPSLTEAGLQYLKDLRNLRTLTVGGDGDWVSETAIRELQEALPNCEIHKHGEKMSHGSPKGKKGPGKAPG